MIKRLFKIVFNAVLFFLILLRKTLNCFGAFLSKCARHVNILISIIQKIPEKLKSGINFTLVPLNHISGYKKLTEMMGGEERIYLPRIVGLSLGGYIMVNMGNDYLCELKCVSFVPYSDFLRDSNGNVSNEKLLRKEYDVLIPRDRDILQVAIPAIKLASKTESIYLKSVFNMMGTNSNHWAHFFAQHYPKLHFLKNLPKEDLIDLVVPEDIDSHIRYLIMAEIKSYPHIRLTEVPVETEVFCDKLYHVQLGTFLADEGYFPTPFASLISQSTLRFWRDATAKFLQKETKQYRRIFIGRGGNRSLRNYDEVKKIFIERGFVEVFPHLLTIEDKIKLFSEAKYIAGPGSSGFINSVYSQSGTRILAFFNSYRYLDTYLPAYSYYAQQEFWFMTGRDEDLNDMNSSYEIDLSEINKFLDNVFFENDSLTVN